MGQGGGGTGLRMGHGGVRLRRGSIGDSIPLPNLDPPPSLFRPASDKSLLQVHVDQFGLILDKTTHFHDPKETSRFPPGRM